MRIVEKFFELQFAGCYFHLYHAKEALKNKEYISGMTFINIASLAFAKSLADWKAPDAVTMNFLERKVLPKVLPKGVKT